MAKINIEEINSAARDMKYEALYWALGFEELEKGIFTKAYYGKKVIIDVEKQIVDYQDNLSIVNGTYLKLTTHKSFVILECIDKLLTMGYLFSEIILDLDNEYDIYCKDLYIRCFEWGHIEEDKVIINKDVFKSISYSSRLISGVIERVSYIKTAKGIYDTGIFNNVLSNSEEIESKNFIIKSGVVIKYLGKDKVVNVPNGVKELSPCLFWDNQDIKEVILPNTLVNISGDTFYNCTNLEKVNIPFSVKRMGNNPFAGCPKINVSNESPLFNLKEGVLYNHDFTKLIYYPINKKEESYIIDSRCRIIGKHAFYLCDNLKELTLPESLIKLENNPFSGCTKLNIINKSNYYHIEDKVIYDKDYSSVIGCLNSIDTDKLLLKNVKRICRNSFWNCKGIRKIVLPETLLDIGYNPFVSCSNIEFESKSKYYVVFSNALYTKDKSKLVCYPPKFALGDIYLPDEVITLERGAFSGCNKMTSINLHNVSIISKTCFTNCDELSKVYCSDLVSYIGEWAFAHCKNLKEISIYKDCFVDKNVILNSPAKIIQREELSNYVIESDNLYSLKSMKSTYKERIKSIIIDPPYNSNISYIGYKDKYEKDTYQEFILSRLRLAYDLLTKDGFLVINIDKGELRNIKKICSTLFYKVKVHKWEKLHPYFDKNRNVDPNKKKVKYEYIIICYKSDKSILKDIHQPCLENNKLKERVSKVPNTFRCFGTNSSAKDEIKEIFGDRTYFQTPKPLKLIKELVRATTNKDSLVLDFFAGSGTTGHAVIDLNKEDNGKRNFILISNSESDICKKVTVKRIEKGGVSFTYIN